jgi:anti-sigma regulatory factor (Ser/Thr protein kinase)
MVEQLEAKLPAEMREAITLALRELLNNAIEHGCKLEASKRVEVSYVRLNQAVVCWIRDPGEGFDPSRLEHAAVGNPSNEPFRHVLVREEKRLRPGGFGILITNDLIDDLAYNEPRNQVMFIKYLP